MAEKEKLVLLLKKSKIFPEEIQKKVGRDRALVYVVHLIEKNDIKPTFQRICISAFKLFPESFSFTEFSEYPDSRTVRNCLWHCTHISKRWLKGSDKTGYSVTEKGREIFKIFLILVERGMDSGHLPLSLRLSKKELVTKPVDEEHSLREIKLSKAFNEFYINKNKISPLDIKKSLGGDRYSPINFLEESLSKNLQMAKLRNDKKILEYLSWLKLNWKKLIEN